GQVTVGDIVLARYTPAAWRGRVYAMRFFLIFTTAGPAVWVIGRLWDRGGADLVLFVTAIIAGIFAINSLGITALVAGAEGRRARAAAGAPAGKESAGRGRPVVVFPRRRGPLGRARHAPPP